MATKKKKKKVTKKKAVKKKVAKKSTKKATKKKQSKKKTSKKKTRSKKHTPTIKNQTFEEMVKIGKNGDLTTRQELFCHEYVNTNYNGSKAAIKAGYKPSNAHQEQYHLLRKPKIIKRIGEIAGEAIDPAQEKIKRIIQQVEELCEVNAIDLFTECSFTGEPILKPIKQLKEEGFAYKIIESFESTKHGIKVRTMRKAEALKLVSELHGLLKSSLELTGAGGGPVEVKGLDAFYVDDDNDNKKKN